METIELRNFYGSLLYEAGQVVFVNRRTGEAAVLSGGDEFVLYLEREGKTHILPAGAFGFCGLKKDGEGKKLTLTYRGENLLVEVTYTAREETFEKRILVSAPLPFYIKRAALENRTVNRALSRGGEGQPVFVGREMWCGIEFPAASNRFEGDTLCFTQAPFEKTSRFESLPVVYGFGAFGDLSRSFEAYIRKKSVRSGDRQPLRIYCDWGLHDDLTDHINLTEIMTLENIERIAALSEKSGVKFDYYLMDAYWFEENQPYIRFKKSTFPHGVETVLKQLEQKGMKYGLWFDLNCIHAHWKGMEKYDALLESGALCFACDDVAEAMTEALSHHIQRHGVRMIKLDFAYFECANPDHGHSVEHTESKEKSVGNFIRMIGKLKALQPDLKILCYNGWTTELDWIGSVQERKGYAISPYWCEYVDYLYCGDPRPSEISCGDFSHSLVYYTDAMIRNFREASMPFSAIDDHGTMMGSTSTIYGLGKKLFRQGVLMDVMRGGGKVHLYGDVSGLDEDDLRYFSFVDGVYGEIVRGGYETDFILGDARKGEIYGYAADGGASGYAVALNPSSRAEKCLLALPAWKNCRLKIETLIRDGELTRGADKGADGLESEAEEAYSAYPLELSANGFLLVKWTLLPREKSFDKTAVCRGETLIFDTEGKTSLQLTFTMDGTGPLRTARGYPEGLKVTADGKPLVSAVDTCIWSGISWLYFPLDGEKRVEVEYSGKTPIWIKYFMTEEKE